MANIVVAFFHGGAEGADQTHTPRGHQQYLGEDRGDVRSFARAAIDGGADLVVGSGPHVLRGMERYHKRLIAYSLGDFGASAVTVAGDGTLAFPGAAPAR
jgi:poly-gamma-glutamate capsule biosynthesis protein CapA/YwtB (metallophosphatase superfamily)